jgi:hypothetical protein
MGIGTDVNTTAGAILYVSEDVPATDTLVAFQEIGNYVKIGEVTDFGEVPLTYTAVNFENVEERQTKVLKGGKEPQTVTYSIGRVVSDSGQALLKLYADNATYRDEHLTVKIVLKDGTELLGAALVMSCNTGMAGMNSVTVLTVSLTFNSTVWEDTSTFWTVRYVTSDHGIVIGATTQRVADGEDGEYVCAVPDDGYEFTDWDEDSSTDNPRQDTAVAADATYTATFTIIT